MSSLFGVIVVVLFSMLSQRGYQPKIASNLMRSQARLFRAEEVLATEIRKISS